MAITHKKHYPIRFEMYQWIDSQTIEIILIYTFIIYCISSSYNWSKVNLNSDFSFSSTIYWTKAKETGLPYYLWTLHYGQDMAQGHHITWVRSIWIQTFPSPRQYTGPRLKKPVCPTIYANSTLWARYGPRSSYNSSKVNLNSNFSFS